MINVLGTTLGEEEVEHHGCAHQWLRLMVAAFIEDGLVFDMKSKASVVWAM